ncbi:MetQ/NlpA family ABC transporter substrate-binding protein, partial [Staphylococcus pseudintermedius]|uniref:MetQ/NlpA family ABC transporter substrate-binding protein n=1 Tax=Staphylococcus pseudintermedius TaxID=283734 RepID=UPI000E36C9A4
LVLDVFVVSACDNNKTEKVTLGIDSNDTKGWEKVKEVAKKEVVDLGIKQFSDYNVPNTALNDGDIDMNAFQHFAFLEAFKKANKGTEITPIRTTVLAPLGGYAEKLKYIIVVQGGAKVLIPNDVFNLA